MPYVNFRWLGGMLTNFQTVHSRVAKLRELQRIVDSGEIEQMPKKEGLKVRRDLAKLERNLGGIKNLEKLPSVVFVIDTKKEHIAVTEANRLKIPVVAVVDTNCDPDVIDFVIPGNDDAIRSAQLMCRVIADAVIEGKQIASRRNAAPGHARRGRRPGRRAGAAAAHRRGGGGAPGAAGRGARRRGRASSARSRSGPGQAEGRQGPEPEAEPEPRPTAPATEPTADDRPRPRPTPRPKPTDTTGETKTMADDLREGRRGAAQGDRRRDDGLQEARSRRASGDIDAAKDWLREKGLAGAAKRAGREADQGAIEVLRRGQRRRARRAELRDRLRRQGRRLQGARVADLTQLVVAQGDADLGDAVARRRDRRRLRQAASPARSARRSSSAASCASRPPTVCSTRYKHIQNERGTIGVLVELGGVDAGDAKAREVAHDIALHIASAAPALRQPRRRPGRRGRARARRSSRRRPARRASPSRRWPKIVEGKLNGFFKTVALLEQSFVKDQKTTIGALVDGLGGECRRSGGSPASRSARSSTPRHRSPRGVADAREPVPPSGAQALG